MSENVTFALCIGGSLHGEEVSAENKTLEVANTKGETFAGIMRSKQGEVYALRRITRTDGTYVLFWVVKSVDLAEYVMQAITEKIEREKNCA